MFKKNKSINKVIPQMFDVKPVNSSGDLDLKKINQVVRASRVSKISTEKPLKKIFP